MTLIVTVGISILAYYLTITFLSEQINVRLIDVEFAKKIGIIVSCSWLTVYLLHKFQRCCFPPYQEKVLSGQISHKDDLGRQPPNARLTARTFGDLVDTTQAPVMQQTYAQGLPAEREPLL